MAFYSKFSASLIRFSQVEKSSLHKEHPMRASSWGIPLRGGGVQELAKTE